MGSCCGVRVGSIRKPFTNIELTEEDDGLELELWEDWHETGCIQRTDTLLDMIPLESEEKSSEDVWQRINDTRTCILQRVIRQYCSQSKSR